MSVHVSLLLLCVNQGGHHMTLGLSIKLGQISWQPWPLRSRVSVRQLGLLVVRLSQKQEERPRVERIEMQKKSSVVQGLN